MTKARGIRLPEKLEQEIQREADRSRRNWSQVVTDLLEEAVRMRRVPGVIFTTGPAGRRATVAGTGLDVWEVISGWRACDEDYERLRESYPWVDETQLRAALSYYRLFPDEIDERLDRERDWTAEKVWSEFPFSEPRRDESPSR